MWGVIWIFMSVALSMHIRLFPHARWHGVKSKYPYHHKRYFRVRKERRVCVCVGGQSTTTLTIFFIIANELARQHFLHERLYDMGPGTARKGKPPLAS